MSRRDQYERRAGATRETRRHEATFDSLPQTPATPVESQPTLSAGGSQARRGGGGAAAAAASSSSSGSYGGGASQPPARATAMEEDVFEPVLSQAAAPAPSAAAATSAATAAAPSRRKKARSLAEDEDSAHSEEQVKRRARGDEQEEEAPARASYQAARERDLEPSVELQQQRQQEQSEITVPITAPEERPPRRSRRDQRKTTASKLTERDGRDAKEVATPLAVLASHMGYVIRTYYANLDDETKVIMTPALDVLINDLQTELEEQNDKHLDNIHLQYTIGRVARVRSTSRVDLSDNQENVTKGEAELKQLHSKRNKALADREKRNAISSFLSRMQDVNFSAQQLLRDDAAVAQEPTDTLERLNFLRASAEVTAGNALYVQAVNSMLSEAIELERAAIAQLQNE